MYYRKGEGTAVRKLIQFVFIRTLPVLFAFLFLGIAFGLLLQRAGYNAVWALCISAFVYAGSMQFVLIPFLGTEASIFTIIFMTLSINCRHIFYGLSFIEKFKSMGKAYPYMIFSLTDETYSLLCSTKVPDDLDEKKVFFGIALFTHIYWISGSVTGALLGELITFDTTGIEFAMTALFVVIFIEQWLSARNHVPAAAGLLCGVVSLVIFGPGSFILPALIAVVVIILASKNTIQAKEGAL